MYDAALLDVFGRSDSSVDRPQRPELLCFEEAHTFEEVYAQRLRALLYHQAAERRQLQETVGRFICLHVNREEAVQIGCTTRCFTIAFFCFSSLSTRYSAAFFQPRVQSLLLLALSSALSNVSSHLTLM